MKKIIVISDFDGTITTRDALVEMLDSYAGPKWRAIAKLVKNGSMGTKVALRKEMELLNISKTDFVNFLRRHIKIDGYFRKLLLFCRENKIKFIVVSGGFGLNIRTVFKKYRIRGVPYYANVIKFKGGSGRKIMVEYPYVDRSCRDCGHCKAPYIRAYILKGYFTIYIGDSVTDRCPARVADLVFAKHHLAEYCNHNHIKYVPYSTFRDIKTYLSENIITTQPK